MANTDVIPELKQILGAMIFGCNRSLSVKEMRKCLQEVAQMEGGETAAFEKVTEADVRAALDNLATDVRTACCGLHLGEIAGGSRFHSDASCGKWLRHLLNAGKPNRLSRPALETLAIIAYRQPASRADIEAVRGVTVDHIIKTLLEMQLIKIVGRSELPGRPFLYATTLVFLEHFGLKDLSELSSMEPMLLAAREEQVRKQKAQAAEEKTDNAEIPEGKDGTQNVTGDEKPSAKTETDLDDDEEDDDDDEEDDDEEDDDEDEEDDDEEEEDTEDEK
ncbi:MAG: SMC-Scp complex subunit ScpB [Kiritimatiellae bacterium]|nr:SMC-Scp complex subunit ScpB [Kiritimatiellia bacterium]MDD5520717.1 SMC-Scp complex subunit ScpB [Kiritimatiellia bacterium]